MKQCEYDWVSEAMPCRSKFNLGRSDLVANWRRMHPIDLRVRSDLMHRVPRSHSTSSPRNDDWDQVGGLRWIKYCCCKGRLRMSYF